MSRTLAHLRNIGPETARRLVALGIADEAALRRVGAVEAYRRLKAADPRHTSLNALWALAGALLPLPWTRLPADLKETLRAEAMAEHRPVGYPEP
ncbi:MAG: competence protein TfoX [Alphaproteobacteria bacterium]|nr:competence protein TfoX [Alphaproteobacteria bacterium]